MIQFLCEYLWNTTGTFHISQHSADYLHPFWPRFDLWMNGSQALKNALGNPVLLSPPLFSHPDTTGMSTISRENENQIAYQELTIWGSWLLLPNPLPDVSSLHPMMCYWVLVSPFQICFYAANKQISSGFIFSENVSSFSSSFLISLKTKTVCLVCPPLCFPPPLLPTSAPLNMNAEPRNKERRPREKCVSLRLARYPSCMWGDKSFSSCVWLGQQCSPLNILLSVLHCPDSTASHTDT